MFGDRVTLVTSRTMDGAVDQFAGLVATTIELIMILVIIIGTVKAAIAIAVRVARREALASAVRSIWLHYAGWILLSLEFALAADIIRTVVGPSWASIGQLAAIAAIRIALSYFFGRDMDEVEHAKGDITSESADLTAPGA